MIACEMLAKDWLDFSCYCLQCPHMWMNRTAPGHARLIQYGDAMMAVEHVKAVRIASMYPYLMVAVPCLPRGWEVIVSLLPACFR